MRTRREGGREGRLRPGGGVHVFGGRLVEGKYRPYNWERFTSHSSVQTRLFSRVWQQIEVNTAAAAWQDEAAHAHFLFL